MKSEKTPQKTQSLSGRSISRKESIARLQCQLTLARSEGNTKLIRIIQAIIERLETLDKAA
jgi:hypothetical protein